MAILNDSEIKRLAHVHGLVDPFRPENVQPASIDLTLGDEFKVFRQHAEIPYLDLSNPIDMTDDVVLNDGYDYDQDEHVIIHPGEFILGVTEERVHIPADLVARVEGKSSLGRLGLLVHATAGFVDPGFRGRITLEMFNLLRVPIRMKPGLKVCQLSFEEMVSPAEQPYRGRYQDADGVQSSRYGQVLPHEDIVQRVDNGVQETHYEPVEPSSPISKKWSRGLKSSDDNNDNKEQ